MANFEKYDFGKRLLESYGWQSGKGLGRNESGISEALKPTLKFDKAGVGHNHKDDFSFHWWDHVFKKASSNIVVENSEEGVQMRQKEDDPDLISTKRWKHKKKKKQNKESSSGSSQLTYGIFKKSSVLTAEGEKREKPEEASSSDEEEDQLLHRTEDDEALFKACEGRTAHKGARHGLTASGKLLRLEAQENGLTLTNGSSSPKPKKRKRKHTSVVENDYSVVTVADEGDGKPRKKKKKKKQSHKTQDALIDVGQPDMLGTAVDNHGIELSGQISREEKAVPKESESVNFEKLAGNDEELVQINLKKKKKKKKKHRRDENIC